MVLGVPIPDYDPNKENFGQHKPSINGSINDELNVLARERRRSRFTFLHYPEFIIGFLMNWFNPTPVGGGRFPPPLPKNGNN